MVSFNRPPALALPDAQAWQAKHKVKPYDLAETPNLRRLAESAAKIHTEDWSTLDADKSVLLHGQMDGVCAAVGALCRLDETTLVFFDHTRKRFIAYPLTSTLLAH